MPPGSIHGAGKGLEQGFDNMMWFIAVEQLQVQITTGLIGEALEKLAGQAKSEGARSVLLLFRR